MPVITDRSTKEPVLKAKKLNHGTLGCTDLARTRKFYEEVLGLQCIQTSPVSMMVSKNTEYVYAVVESPAHKGGMNMLNHNGFEVETPEEVEEAYQALAAVKDKWGIKVQKPATHHGACAFYFLDFDGNWWEVVSAGKEGYIGHFRNKDHDLTGQHQVDDWVDHYNETKHLKHTSSPTDRAEMLARRGG